MVYILLIVKQKGNTLWLITLLLYVQVDGKTSEQNQLLWWIQHYGILPNHQSSFRKGHLCSDNIRMLVTTADIGFHTNKHTTVVSLDINSVFVFKGKFSCNNNSLQQLRIKDNFSHFFSHWMYERKAHFIGSNNLENNYQNRFIDKGLLTRKDAKPSTFQHMCM